MPVLLFRALQIHMHAFSFIAHSHYRPSAACASCAKRHIVRAVRAET
jgi:hypothetical protein